MFSCKENHFSYFLKGVEVVSKGRRKFSLFISHFTVQTEHKTYIPKLANTLNLEDGREKANDFHFRFLCHEVSRPSLGF